MMEFRWVGRQVALTPIHWSDPVVEGHCYAADTYGIYLRFAPHKEEFYPWRGIAKVILVDGQEEA